MNRRQFFIAAAAVAAASKAKAAPLSGNLSLPPLNPYGADRLEATDVKALEQSLRDQLTAAGIPVPALFRPFPRDLESMPNAIAGVVGETENLNELITGSYTFSKDFDNQPDCNRNRLEDTPVSWRVFVALHETSHVIARHPDKTGISLLDRMAASVLKIVPRNITSYLTDLMETTLGDTAIEKLLSDPDALIGQTAQDRKFDRLTTTLAISAQLSESIADVSAILYMLSNYKDVRSNPAIIREIMDFRTGRYIDYTHDTSEAIQAAFDAFIAHPNTGMTLDETVQIAGRIIGKVPRFNKSPEELADTIRHDFDTIHSFKNSKTDNLRRDTIIAARNHVCSRALAP